MLRRCAVYAETEGFTPYIGLAAALEVAVPEGLCQSADISKVQELGPIMGTGPGAPGSCLTRVSAQITETRARLAGLHVGEIICPKK